jgi:hypothetical protein
MADRPQRARPARRARASTRARRAASEGAIGEQLAAHLSGMSVPFLFVGAGLTIRYAGGDTWTDLLRRFAQRTAKPYEYFVSTADGDLPAVATLLAEELHQLWWNDPAFEQRRSEDGALITNRDSALKVEISRYLERTVDALPDAGPLADEIGLLKEAVIDGIITTNFDPILEHIRDDLQPFVGQDELLFADPQGIGEIYKIHGSCTQPNSLVLTTQDYQQFEERNAYLVAKLLTIFVEHPVVFLGYRLGDSNIQSILVEIARCLETDERIEQLRDRLLFVDWRKDDSPSMTSTVISAEGFTIPIQRIVVPDYAEVFEVLGRNKRRFPARLLRYLREEVYELANTSQPSGRLYVEDLDATTDLSDVEVYAGVGLRARLTSYVGLSRVDLLNDVLLDDRHLIPERVVGEALANPRLASKTTMVPIYKYLRGADLLDRDGALRDPAAVAPRVAERVSARTELLRGSKSYKARGEELAASFTSFTDFVNAGTPEQAIYALPYLEADQIDLETLRLLLLLNRNLFDDNHQPAASQWAKAVCIYDWLMYGASRP